MKRGAHSRSSSTLLGIAEVHDLSFAYQVEPLLRLLSDEADLLPDLLRARPWLAEGSPQEVLETLLEQEWVGFLARLGRLGPWVFAPTVTDLQALSGAYTAVVEAARRSELQSCAPASLLGRLREDGELSRSTPSGEADSNRTDSNRTGSNRTDSNRAEEAEQAFWALAQTRASGQRASWAARMTREHRVSLSDPEDGVT